MGLFKKKRDPISERAKTLNRQIAALQTEIERLSDAPPPAETPFTVAEAKRPGASAGDGSKGGSTAVPGAAATPASPRPKLRSTAFPQKNQPSHPAGKEQAAPRPGPNPFSEPVFEEVKQNAARQPAEPVSSAHYNELGVRKYDLVSLWRRWTNNFRGPATSNPRLVNYLAAGSIQGLRPLRYEKRVARNRFIVLVLFLIAVLWGLIAILFKRS